MTDTLDPAVTALRGIISERSTLQSNAFAVVKGISILMARRPSGDPDVQELILRALEVRHHFGASTPILDALVREVGLFPYIAEANSLSFADNVAMEYHRPSGLDERNIIFHRPQGTVYRELMAGRNVVLSAPTSFGKSLITDAIIASGKFDNIMMVVPTIALIDETRRRLAGFSKEYKIITHAFQAPAKRNIYVMTQERVLEHKQLGAIQFFVIDEFYKLRPVGKDDDRAQLLNQVFYKLSKQGAQFYLLGPTVASVVPEVTSRFNALVVNEPHYHTVVSELHRVPGTGDDLVRLVDLCKTLVGPTIVYCASVPRATEVAKVLAAAGVGKRSNKLAEAADWMERNYHKEWHVPAAVRNGVGVHHGRIPRALGQWMVRNFNDEKLRILVCTSTLIEGVNTKAQNIVVFDNKIDTKRFDLFTFNNIRGRSGRMFRHFVGHVYLFHDPPENELPLIDMPGLTQSANAGAELLMQLDEEDLTSVSRDRLKPYRDQHILSLETLKANVGIDLDRQLAVAREIMQMNPAQRRLLLWSGVPTYKQLIATCELIWLHFKGGSLGSGSARSPGQLATMLLKLMNTTPAQLIADQAAYYKSQGSDADADAAVQKVLDFIRLWAMFHAPRLLRAISLIQRDVAIRTRTAFGNYEAFAALLENAFMDPALVALDEYGVPTELGRKLRRELGSNGDLDSSLRKLELLDVERLANLSPFEKSLIVDAQRGLR